LKTYFPISNKLWIHAKIKACVAASSCDPVSLYKQHQMLEFSLIIIIFQELCLDINNPNGMGRRKKRSSFSGFVEPIQKSTSELVQRRRDFFPVDPDDNHHKYTEVENKTKVDQEELNGQSTRIDENVSITVLVPGGKGSRYKRMMIFSISF